MKNESNIKQEGYHSSAHLKYLCRYHVIFCPKYRRKVLVDGIDTRLKEVFQEIAQTHGFSILEMEVMPPCTPAHRLQSQIWDHAVCDRPQMGSCPCLKCRIPTVKKEAPIYLDTSCFVATVGSVSLETVKQYIASQKGK